MRKIEPNEPNDANLRAKRLKSERNGSNFRRSVRLQTTTSQNAKIRMFGALLYFNYSKRPKTKVVWISDRYSVSSRLELKRLFDYRMAIQQNVSAIAFGLV